MNALASLGSSAKGANTALVNSLDDKDAAVQISAIRAIGKIESDDSLAERLVKFLDGANEETRLAVVVPLGGFQTPDSAVNSLVGVFEVEHAETQSAVFGALAKLGSSAKPALPALNTALNHDNESVRARRWRWPRWNQTKASCSTHSSRAGRQGRCGPAHGHSRAGRTGLRRPALQAPHCSRGLTHFRRPAGHHGSAAKIRVRDVQLYISILHNEEPLVRFFACQALRRAGKMQKPAEEELRKLQKDSYDFVRVRPAVRLRRCVELRLSIFFRSTIL